MQGSGKPKGRRKPRSSTWTTMSRPPVLVHPDLGRLESADRCPRCPFDQSLDPLFEIASGVVEVPRGEASQSLQVGCEFVSELAMDLHVVVVITVAVGDVELLGEVQCERRRTVERVGPVLEQKAIDIGCVRDVEQPSAETEEGR